MNSEKPKLPRSREELLADLEAHPERGTIGGEPVIKGGTIEFKTTVPTDLYNAVLLVGVGNGLGSKTNIALIALTDFIARPEVIDNRVPDIELQDFERSPEASRDFRAAIPQSSYEMLQQAVERLGITITEAGYYALTAFASHPGYQHNYNKFVEKWGAKHGVSRSEIESTVFGYWKKLGRAKRLNLVSEGNPESQERKMT